MAARLTALGQPLANLKSMLAELDGPWKLLVSVFNYRIAMQDYLVYSTAASVFTTVLLFHKGIDIFIGYPIVLLNTIILCGQDRLVIHRNHALAIFVVLMVSLFASANSATPAASILAQIIGITLFSVYFFSMLTNFGLSVPRWMEVYCQFALGVAAIGVITFVLRRLHFLPETTQIRLRSYFAEPSLFVYSTLPALGIYANTWLRHRTHLPELGFLLFCYALAGSTLGFLGIFLIVFFAALPRLNIWKMMLLGVVGMAALVGLFIASADFRLRIVDLALAMRTMDITSSNSTTFAVLSNAYVTFQTFVSHPFIGVGIGGYQYAYTRYMPILGNNLDDPSLVTLNMFDANSLFFRTAAELGSFGLIVLIGFLVICGRVKGDRHIDIRNALLPYMIVRMSRFGAWFSMEVYFFVGLYLLNYMHSRAASRAKAAEASTPVTEPRPAG